MESSILLIEDNKSLSYLLTTVFSEYNVKTVESGYEAMQLLVSDYETNLIILDIPTVSSDNLELLEHLSTSSFLKDIPVVVISNSNDSNLKEAVLTSGASVFYTKPFNPVILKAKVTALLENTRPQVIHKKKSVFNLNIF